jgi:hypothetical protein
MSSKRKRSKPKKSGGGKPVTPVNDETIADDLEAMTEDLAVDETGQHWGGAHRLLLKSSLDNADAATIIATRDLAKLRAAIASLRGDDSVEIAEESTESAPDIDPETLRKAMRAFRKRLKLTILDEESKLSVRPLTSGKESEIVAILPPREFPREVWLALCSEGKLRDAGRGFFELID